MDTVCFDIFNTIAYLAPQVVMRVSIPVIPALKTCQVKFLYGSLAV